jgi:hypothetical protein
MIGMGIDIQAAQTTTQTANTMRVATQAIGQASKAINIDQLAADRQRMDGLKQRLGAAHDLLTNGEGDMEVNAGAEELLTALEEENNQLAMLQIADIPEGVPTYTVPGQPTNAH